MSRELLLPSEALNRSFVMGDQQTDDAASDSAGAARKINTTHGVRIENLGLLLPHDEISEVVEKLAYCRLPNTPEHLAGMASMRGTIVPVFDLALMLGVGSRSNSTVNVLIIGQGKKSVVFLTNTLPAKQILMAEHRLQALPPLPERLRPHVRACYIKDGQLWIDWDIYRFISSNSSAA